MTTGLTALGDRLGLFKDLANNGPATPAELAERAGVNERYAAEWLRGMAAAEYLEHDRGSDRYTLPPEHAVALAHEGADPAFLCGTMQMVPAMFEPFDQLAEAFRNGGGVQQSEFGADWWDGMQRFTAAWFESELMNDWMPALPHVHEKLERARRRPTSAAGRGGPRSRSRRRTRTRPSSASTPSRARSSARRRTPTPPASATG